MVITKKNEKPFSFYERDLEAYKARINSEAPVNEENLKPAFKAKEPPGLVMVEIYKKMVEEDEIARRERILQNAKKSYEKASLPPRMEMHEIAKKHLK